jgi:hypothetical protein
MSRHEEAARHADNDRSDRLIADAVRYLDRGGDKVFGRVVLGGSAYAPRLSDSRQYPPAGHTYPAPDQG